MSLLDQNWGTGGSADEEVQDDNQQGRQVKFIDLHYCITGKRK